MSIVLCVPTLKLDTRHQDHLVEFYAANKGVLPPGADAVIRDTLKKFQMFGNDREDAAAEIESALRSRFDLRLFRQWHRALHHIQQGAVNFAWSIGASHILFTEDDQWRYPVDGLQTLLEADKDVIGFKTYFKLYPFKPMCANKKDPHGNLIEDPNIKNMVHWMEQGGGEEIQQRDLITWAFTLVKMSVFDRMQAANLYPFRQWGPHPTDSFFCQYCADLKIPIHVHYGWTIGHGDVDPEDIVYHRRFYEAMELSKRRVRMPSLQVARDDHGNAYGWSDEANGNGKALLEMQEESGEPVMYDGKGEAI